MPRTIPVVLDTTPGTFDPTKQRHWKLKLFNADGTPAGAGSAGSPGTDGSDGAPGASAYEVWLAAGNSGTVNDYLATLQGPEGPPGSGLPFSAGAYTAINPIPAKNVQAAAELNADNAIMLRHVYNISVDPGPIFNLYFYLGVVAFNLRRIDNTVAGNELVERIGFETLIPKGVSWKYDWTTSMGNTASVVPVTMGYHALT